MNLFKFLWPVGTCLPQPYWSPLTCEVFVIILFIFIIKYAVRVLTGFRWLRIEPSYVLLLRWK